MPRRLIATATLVAAVLLPTEAHADSRVVVVDAAGEAQIDPAYATTLRVSGHGFQSVRGGHGGIYVFFGTVKPGWQPSKGGVTGRDYFYVPDSETQDNAGFQRFVAFPGSDTAGSANGGTLSASGSWSTDLVVPGAVFRAYDQDGRVRTIDCRRQTCGVITVGAHGVANAHNESFTPVTVARTAATGTTSPAPQQPAADPISSATERPTSSGPGAAPRPAGPATLEVDRTAAVAGNVLAFSAHGLEPGAQVSAVLDDGAAGAGPFVAGPDGQLSGVLTLPATTSSGTHELRLYGVADPPAVRFAVREPGASTADPATPDDGAAADPADAESRAAWLFAGLAGVALLLALVRLGVRAGRVRRAAA